MGIPGLLVALKSYISSTSQQQQNTNNTNTNNIYTDYQNKNIAIDASSWFHKSVYSIADHYVECVEQQQQKQQRMMNPNHPYRIVLDEKCINVSTQYMIQRMNELLYHGQINTIYLVLDGKRCPLKSCTNDERNQKRTITLQMARKYKQQNQLLKSYELYKSCIKIIDELSYVVAQNIHNYYNSNKNNQQQPSRVQIIYSPYEADPQLVQLCRPNHPTITTTSSSYDDSCCCHAIITEDSDVLVYCATCSISVPIIYKLDRKSGQYELLSMDWLLLVQQSQPQPQHRTNTHPTTTTTANSSNNNNSNSNKTIHTIFDILVQRNIQYPGWGTRLFVQACILAGCDYTVVGNSAATATAAVTNTDNNTTSTADQQKHNNKLIPGMGFVNAFKYIQMAGLHLHQQQLQLLQQSQQQQQQSTVGNNVTTTTTTTTTTNPNYNNNNVLDTIYEYIVNKLLPIKSRRMIQYNINNIILLLHQSECVFYYHPVLVNIIRNNNNKNNDNNCTVQYLNDIYKQCIYQPSIQRYHPNTDISLFIGTLTCNPAMIKVHTTNNIDSGIIPQNIHNHHHHHHSTSNTSNRRNHHHHQNHKQNALTALTNRHQNHQQHHYSNNNNNINKKHQNSHNNKSNSGSNLHPISVVQINNSNNISNSESVNDKIMDDLSTLSGGDVLEHSYSNDNKENHPPLPPPPRPIRNNPYLHNNSKQQQVQQPKKGILTNPFENYARRHRDVGLGIITNQIVTAKLPVRKHTSNDINISRNIIGPNKNDVKPDSFQINTEDVRFVKRIDFKDDGNRIVGDLENGSHRKQHLPMPHQQVLPQVCTVPVNIEQLHDKKRIVIHTDQLTRKQMKVDGSRKQLVVQHSIPSASVEPIMDTKKLSKTTSKYFSNDHHQQYHDHKNDFKNSNEIQQFLVPEECPPKFGSATTATDSIVSLHDFDHYNDTKQVSSSFYNNFDYDVVPDNVTDYPILNDDDYKNASDYNNDIRAPAKFHVGHKQEDFRCNIENVIPSTQRVNYHRRITLEMSDDPVTTTNDHTDEIVSPPAVADGPIQYNFYDDVIEVIHSSPTNNNKSDGILLEEDVNTNKTIQPLKSKHYRLGPPLTTVKSSIKKVVKRGSSKIKSFLQKQHGKRNKNHQHDSVSIRVPYKSTILSHFQIG